MIRGRGRCIWGWGLAALVLLTAQPSVAPAGWFGVRNDSKMVVAFQGASVVNGVVRRGKAHILAPGQETWELIAPGPKILAIYDARVPGRVLYEADVIIGPKDLFYSIQVGVVVVPPGIQVPQATLTAAKPMTKPR